METEQVIEIPYEPRKQQLEIHEKLDAHRFGAAVCHRRFGKTVLAINHLAKAALTCARDRPRFAYIAPTYRQGKAIAWDYLKHYTHVVPGREANESELRVDLPNGSQIRIYGADNPDSLRGLYFDGVVLDEFGLMPSRTFSEVVRPALADRQGWAFFIGTPNGKNHFYDVCQQARTEAGWFFAEFKASQTGLIRPEELEMARKSMTPDEYAQEWECSFEASVKGAIFADELRRAREQKRIKTIPYDRTILVDTFWDLGVGDATSIWFVQATGLEIRLIDFYESSGQGLDHYISVLKQKGYSYGRHVGPHDIEVKEFGSGKTRLEMARELGINFEVAPKLGLEDGINAARLLFDRCYFDQDRCKLGLDALMNYRRDFNTRIDEFKPVPVHDWASHGADAFRYMAVSIRRRDVAPARIDYSKLSKGIV
jgi:phage terminase large subunit